MFGGRDCAPRTHPTLGVALSWPSDPPQVLNFNTLESFASYEFYSHCIVLYCMRRTWIIIRSTIGCSHLIRWNPIFVVWALACIVLVSGVELFIERGRRFVNVPPMPYYTLNSTKLIQLGLKFQPLEAMFDDCVASFRDKGLLGMKSHSHQRQNGQIKNDKILLS